MKTLNILLLGTLLASSFAVNAAAENRHSDRFQYRIYDEYVSKYLERINHKKQNHRNRQKSHDKSYSNGYRNKHANKHAKGHYDYDNRRYDGHQDNRHNRHNQAHNRGRWETVGSIRGRSGKHVTRDINVDERVQALSLQGTKRGMVVRRAHALLGNGRWVRVEGLEGHLRHGEQSKHRLHRARYVKKIVLDIAPDRYKRGYADLRIKPASRKH